VPAKQNAAQIELLVSSYTYSTAGSTAALLANAAVHRVAEYNALLLLCCSSCCCQTWHHPLAGHYR
jgi:hypothetical protein